MQIREIKGTDHIDELMPLFSQHREELATQKHLMNLKPAWDRYKVMEESGILFTLALYDDPIIVGYSSIVVTQNLHYSDLVQAYEDTLFVLPKYRNTTWGIKLIKKAEVLAREKGAKLLLRHCRRGSVCASIMPRMGYYVQDILFGKEL